MSAAGREGALPRVIPTRARQRARLSAADFPALRDAEGFVAQMTIRPPNQSGNPQRRRNRRKTRASACIERDRLQNAPAGRCARRSGIKSDRLQRLEAPPCWPRARRPPTARAPRKAARRPALAGWLGHSASSNERVRDCCRRAHASSSWDWRGSRPCRTTRTWLVCSRTKTRLLDVTNKRRPSAAGDAAEVRPARSGAR